MPAKEPRSTVTSMRLSETGRYLLEAMQDHMGLSMSSVVEFLVREEARRRGISIPGSAAALAARAESMNARAAAVAPKHLRPKKDED